MCDVCRVFSHEHEFDCPQVTEWPDSPFTTEQKISEDHSWALFERANPGKAQEIADEIGVDTCPHNEHHHMVQDWQGVTVLCKVCNDCGATVNLFQNWDGETQ